MLNKKQQLQYLDHLGLKRDLNLSKECFLKQIHLAHLEKIAFENINNFLNKPIDLDVDALFKKVILNKRGGLCFELNYLLYQLLLSLNYKVKLIGARVVHNNKFSIKNSHLLLLVTLKNKKVIVDVGFGNLFSLPVAINGQILVEPTVKYRVLKRKGAFYLEQKKSNTKNWKTKFFFDLKAKNIDDFNKSCLYHQLSKKSIFTRNLICTKLTSNGRITINNNLFIKTIGLKKERLKIKDRARFNAILLDNFAIKLPHQQIEFYR